MGGNVSYVLNYKQDAFTFGGLTGSLAHWLSGVAVDKMGANATRTEHYFPIYAGLAGLIILSTLGIPCFHAIRRREDLQGSFAHSGGNEALSKGKAVAQ